MLTKLLRAFVVFPLLLALSFHVSGVGSKSTTSIPAQPSANINFLLGNPSSATADGSDKNNFLMEKPQYVLSYNNKKGGPNWVSWHLTASDIGTESRGTFHADTALPAGFRRIVTGDYINQSFDRGHICNSKDRTSTRENNDATFTMTNILPQRADNNQGPWKKLEDYCRKLANEGNELYIIAGAFGTKGTTPNKKLNVPLAFWKVVVVLPEGNNDLGRINANTRVITVIMENVQGIKKDSWQKFRNHTVREVERDTKFDLLSNLPKAVQDVIEVKKDTQNQ